jgi:predicted transposase YbfD/YdcC
VTTAPAGSLLEFLRQVPDTRGRQGQRHALSATLAAVVCAVLCGARSYEALAQWLHLQDVSTWHWLGFWRTPPKKTGIRSILLSVDPQALEAVVRCWLAETLDVELDEQNLQPVSIDGKTVRGSLQQHERATHEVAYALTSAPPELAPPKKLLQWWREHWHIENRVHWVRDTTMGEDASTIRTGSAPQVLATVRNMALNVLRTLGTPNVAATLREHALKVEHLFAKLGRFNL